LALPIFAITLFVSAFLLFLVQPMIGKLILPKLGGTPQVWNTCMVFFQSVLLLGYAYTHTVSTKLRLRQQLILHCGLLALPVVMMVLFPFYDYVHDWPPPTEGNPIPATLLLLAIVVGVPFFVVSTSAPLLQRWFAYSGDPAAKDPYFLYGASNLGSLLSLLAYPAMVEPLTVLPMQSTIWFVGYVVLAVMIVYCAYRISKIAPADSVLAAEAAAASLAPAVELKPETPAPAPEPVPAAQTSTAVKAGPGPGAGRSIQRKKGMKHAPGRVQEEKPIAKPGPAPMIATGATREMTPWRRVRWVLLAAVPSSLMLGVTSYISTDLSPFPLVWVVPLALYLLSFILVFMKAWTERRFHILSTTGNTLHQMVLYVGQPAGVIALCFIILSHRFDTTFITSLIMGGFFLTALACHGELAQDRPATKYLTEYFLLMSVGGMIGGVFNAIIAPILFQRGIIEFHIAIIVACMIRPQYVPSGWFDELVLNAFPGLRSWARTQGDEMAKSMGFRAPNTTYLFSLFLDVLFGFFILAVSYWLVATFVTPGSEKVKGVMSFLQLPMTAGWANIVFNIFVYFIPMVFVFFFAGRPLRFSLAVTGLLLANLYFADRDERRVLEMRRTYFGLLRVQEDDDFVRDREENEMFRAIPLKNKDGDLVAPHYPFTFLMHGTTYHGRNYYRSYPDDLQKNRIDLSRLATTYYHRYGPVGIVMEQYNWSLAGIATGKEPLPSPSYPGRQNDFTADVRMPASLVGLALAEQVPWTTLAQTQSEPPLATIGLGTGTMASYARPYGHFTYYEIDEVIRHFSLPERGGEARFTFLQNAIRRGVNLEVIMGDARQSLQYENTERRKNILNSFVFAADFSRPKLGDSYPYADARYNADKQINSVAPDRIGYYKVMNVDAFSSDAIPVHLVTKQAIQIYMDKLAADGVLCVHTSNRHMDLVRPVARIAMDLGYTCRVGKDMGERGRYMGHFSSEYVMIYRGDFFTKYLEKLAAKKMEFQKNFLEAAKKGETGLEEARKAGTLMMRPATRESLAGPAPAGWQILNSEVMWYDPFQDYDNPRFGGRWHKAVTQEDSLWTDDFSHILGILR
jgi:hypothetical protein